MKKSLIEIYALAVCFVAIVCMAISTGVAIYDLVEITFPTFTMSAWKYDKHLSNDAYRSQMSSCGNKGEEKKTYTEEEITKKREASLATAIKSERRGAQQSFVTVLIIIIIDVVLFVVHWKMARRVREESASASPVP